MKKLIFHPPFHPPSGPQGPPDARLPSKIVPIPGGSASGDGHNFPPKSSKIHQNPPKMRPTPPEIGPKSPKSGPKCRQPEFECSLPPLRATGTQFCCIVHLGAAWPTELAGMAGPAGRKRLSPRSGAPKGPGLGGWAAKVENRPDRKKIWAKKKFGRKKNFGRKKIICVRARTHATLARGEGSTRRGMPNPLSIHVQAR